MYPSTPPVRPCASSHACARSTISANALVTSVSLPARSSLMSVRLNEFRCPTVWNPYADSTPGAGGTSTGKHPSSPASAFPCSGPAPPKATRV